MDRKVNFFDKLGRIIPGYEGYKEREGRRECDRILRLKIVSSLDVVESLIMRNEKNQLNDVVEVESVRKRADNLKDKIKYASYGESSLFENSVLSEKELNEIYAIDLFLLKIVKDIEKIARNENISRVAELLNVLEMELIKRRDYLEIN